MACKDCGGQLDTSRAGFKRTLRVGCCCQPEEEQLLFDFPEPTPAPSNDNDLDYNDLDIVIELPNDLNDDDPPPEPPDEPPPPTPTPTPIVNPVCIGSDFPGGKDICAGCNENENTLLPLSTDVKELELIFKKGCSVKNFAGDGCACDNVGNKRVSSDGTTTIVIKPDDIDFGEVETYYFQIEGPPRKGIDEKNALTWWTLTVLKCPPFDPPVNKTRCPGKNADGERVRIADGKPSQRGENIIRAAEKAGKTRDQVLNDTGTQKSVAKQVGISLADLRAELADKCSGANKYDKDNANGGTDKGTCVEDEANCPVVIPSECGGGGGPAGGGGACVGVHEDCGNVSDLLDDGERYREWKPGDPEDLDEWRRMPNAQKHATIKPCIKKIDDCPCTGDDCETTLAGDGRVATLNTWLEKWKDKFKQTGGKHPHEEGWDHGKGDLLRTD